MLIHSTFIMSMNILRRRMLRSVRKLSSREYSSHHSLSDSSWNDIPICLDEEFLCDPKNVPKIQENIIRRKGIGNIELVQKLKNHLVSLNQNNPKYQSTKNQLIKECLLIPNQTHPEVYDLGEHPKVTKLSGAKNDSYEYKEFHEIVKRLNLVRTEQLGNISGNRSYYLLGEMAELEYAVIQYFTDKLLNSGFELVSVPDILPRHIIESCGMNTRGERTQVYTLDPELHEPDYCLSGTSEIALAGYLANSVFDYSELPLKLCAVSRCYRAETSSVAEERGIFRVHEFTKVEMFMVTAPENSNTALEDIRTLQEDLFQSLDLHFQVLDMPPHELGAQAFRKYDIEAWMPGRKMYGEISSCSNCTDFQARRLNIRYNRDKNTDFVHTLNGTACAIPRLMIAITEAGQKSNGTILIPEVLREYMKGKEFIERQKIPELKLVKHKNVQ